METLVKTKQYKYLNDLYVPFFMEKIREDLDKVTNIIYPQGNNKLNGNKVKDKKITHVSSLPALKTSCKFATSTCLSACYDGHAVNMYGFTFYNSMIKRFKYYDMILNKQWSAIEAMLIDNLFIDKNNIVRFHIGGDLDGIDHFNSLNNVAKLYPTKQFYLYTHATDKTFLDYIYSNVASNFQVLISIDDTNIKLLRLLDGYYRSKFRFTYFGSLSKRELNHITAFKWVSCLEQTKKIKCIDCKLCFKDSGYHQYNIYFQQH